jgi:hypothetical protein
MAIPLKQSTLKEELLNELREIVQEDFGENLSDGELFDFGHDLLSYFELLAKIYFTGRKSYINRNIAKC